jgi:hypothetical protein
MTEMLGYAASAAVFATFLMRTMFPLRLVAIASNLLFISYAYLANIHPVLVLHTVLLPINILRLFALLRQGWVTDNRSWMPSLGVRLHSSLFAAGLIGGAVFGWCLFSIVKPAQSAPFRWIWQPSHHLTQPIQIRQMMPD